MAFELRPVRLKDRVPFRCQLCGKCCRNVKNAIMLEPLDIYRLSRHLRAQGRQVDGTEDVLAETMLYVNLPYRGQDGMAVNDNWYRIPVCPVGKGYGIESNTFYDIRARIGMAGSQESHDPVLLEDIDFEVAPWSTTGIPVNDENPSYLILNEYEVIMRGTDRYADLTFTSSSPVSVSVEDAYFIDKDGAVRHLSAQEMEEEK